MLIADLAATLMHLISSFLAQAMLTAQQLIADPLACRLASSPQSNEPSHQQQLAGQAQQDANKSEPSESQAAQPTHQTPSRQHSLLQLQANTTGSQWRTAQHDKVASQTSHTATQRLWYQTGGSAIVKEAMKVRHASGREHMKHSIDSRVGVALSAHMVSTCTGMHRNITGISYLFCLTKDVLLVLGYAWL